MLHLSEIALSWIFLNNLSHASSKIRTLQGEMWDLTFSVSFRQDCREIDIMSCRLRALRISQAGVPIRNPSQHSALSLSLLQMFVLVIGTERYSVPFICITQLPRPFLRLSFC